MNGEMSHETKKINQNKRHCLNGALVKTSLPPSPKPADKLHINMKNHLFLHILIKQDCQLQWNQGG